MHVSVKMKTTKKMMIAALLTLAVLTVGITPIFAAPDIAKSRGVTSSQKGAQNKNMFTQISAQGQKVREQIQQRIQAINAPVDISDLDEAAIDDKFAEVDAAEPIEYIEGSVVWYLNARGMSTPLDPVLEEENPAEPVGLQLIAEKVKSTEYGVLYKILWGRVHHDGEKVEIEGYAILDTDGVFYMKLTGDGLGFKTIGRIAPAGMGVRVAMKGYMSHDDVDYGIKMHGRAIPLRGSLIKNRIRNHLQNQDQSQGTDPTTARRVTPNADTA
jgi:hypothetical protein